MFGERNRIHPNTTRWKVTAQRSQAGNLTRPFHACSMQSIVPWKNPHSTNGHAAPCQSPPSAIVSIRLR